MDYHNHEREINLKSMLFAVLYQWRKIILVALILAVLLGGFKGMKAWNEATDVSVISGYETAHQEAMEVYEESRKTLELQIEDLQTDIENQKTYLENSVLMAMDSRNFYSATASYYISTDYEIMPGMVYQNPDNSSLILMSYLTVLTDSALMNEVAEAMGLDPQYLKELVTISGKMDRMLTIEVLYKDQTGAQRIMNLILSHFGEIRQQVTASIGDHSVSEVMNTVGPDMDTELSDRQRMERDRLKNDMDELAQAQNELEELSEPQRTAVSRGDAVKAAIKFALIGGVAGGLVAVLVACVWFVLTDKVQSGSELSERFGVRILAVYSGDRKRGIVDRWLMKMEGIRNTDAKVADMLLAANVRLYTQDVHTLLVTDWAHSDYAKNVAGCLSQYMKDVKVIPCGNLMEDPAALCALRNCDGVVLAVGCKTSRYSHVEKELEQIVAAGKTLIGCIIFEQ